MRLGMKGEPAGKKHNHRLLIKTELCAGLGDLLGAIGKVAAVKTQGNDRQLRQDQPLNTQPFLQVVRLGLKNAFHIGLHGGACANQCVPGLHGPNQQAGHGVHGGCAGGGVGNAA